MEESTFQYSDHFVVTKAMKEAFNETGFLVIRNLLSEAELLKLKCSLENDPCLEANTISRDDGSGRKSKTVLWIVPGNDVSGLISRSEKVAGTMEQLLGSEVYHYHSKVVLKDPHTGGAFPWHQDYGYWYKNGCLFPNMGTVWIAIDRADRENGCVQLLKGSHKAGRIETAPCGEHVGTDLKRLEHIKNVCPLVYAELEPGDCMFFHCNVLHYSAQNQSDRRRWAYVVAYNRADNNPVKKHQFSCYIPLRKVPNRAIMEDKARDMSENQFYNYNAADYTWNKGKEEV